MSRDEILTKLVNRTIRGAQFFERDPRNFWVNIDKQRCREWFGEDIQEVYGLCQQLKKIQTIKMKANFNKKKTRSRPHKMSVMVAGEIIDRHLAIQQTQLSQVVGSLFSLA